MTLASETKCFCGKTAKSKFGKNHGIHEIQRHGKFTILRCKQQPFCELDGSMINLHYQKGG